MRCRSRASSFAQPVIGREELLKAQAFLLHSGRGFTDVGVDALTHDRLMWHVRNLTERMREENEARAAAIKQAQAKSVASSYRRRR